MSVALLALVALFSDGCAAGPPPGFTPLVSLPGVAVCPGWGEPVATGRLESHADEVSGLVVSRKNPGIFWIEEDDGAPRILAIDRTGRTRAVLWLQGERNLDWEAISLGPCGDGSGEECLYVGAVGDNRGRRSDRALLRLHEPALEAADACEGEVANLRVPVDHFPYRYPDGPKDVESMFVLPDGRVALISKRNPADRARLYLFEPPGREPHALEPHLVASFPTGSGEGRPIPPPGHWWPGELGDQGTGLTRQPTDASLAPDGRLFVRTYGTILAYDLKGDPARAGAVTPCRVPAPYEPQGEGIAWDEAAGGLRLISEGAHPRLWFVPGPR